MRCLLSVCLIALLATVMHYAGAQNPAMRKGVSVQMAVTRNASPMPEADNEDAWIVTVAADGGLYFGADPVTQKELVDWMKTHLRNPETRLYIKAAARAPFANVERVVEIAGSMQVETPVLLTAQAEHNPPGTMVPQKGEDVSVSSALPSGRIATIVQLLPSGQETPLLKINNDDISWSELESTLGQHFQKGDDRLVLLRADGGLPFGAVVRALDGCRAAGAKVYLAEPGV